MIAAMCEQFVARAAEPFRLDELWPLAERMERYGIAGFGWGVTWLGGDGALHEHRDTRAFRDDPARDEVGRHETRSVLVHLRRPSRLSTLQLPDTQPFVDPAGRFAFSHNGELDRWQGARAAYRDQDRIRGRADSEVGQRWLEDAWDEAPPVDLLERLHDGFGGVANLAVIERDGTATHYAGNPENPVFTFRLGRIGLASTAIYSIDRSLFRFAAIGATNRRLVRPTTTVVLDEDGSPRVAPASGALAEAAPGS
jgi:glutamine phosphoribosylpyrophosphate amidotransferase